MKHLLVIGGASYDILHLEDQTVQSIGGVGMYTAMAAQRCGVSASILSHPPDPCPDAFQPIINRLTDWLGPSVSPDQLPHFEISYRAGKTAYLDVSLRSEADLFPEMLPGNVPGAAQPA